MNVSETTSQILNHFSIRETEKRKEILKILLLFPDEVHSINKLDQHLKSNNTIISSAALENILLMFKIRGVIEMIQVETKDKRRKGRPQLKFRISHHIVTRTFT